MSKKDWVPDDIERILANPIYAAGIDPDLFGDIPEPLISKEQWVKANVRLIGILGAETWLYRLLDVLGGNAIKSDTD